MLVFGVILLLFAINLSNSFIRTAGSNHIEYINHVMKTSDNGYLLVGSTSVLSGFGGGDILVVKLDQNGNLLWKRIIGGNRTDEGLWAFESGGSYFITAKSLSFKDGYYYDTLVIKLDQNGTLQKAFRYNAEGENILKFLTSGFSANEYLLVGDGNFDSIYNAENKLAKDIIIQTIDQNASLVGNIRVLKPCKSPSCTEPENNTDERVKVVLKTSDGGLLIGGITDYPKLEPYDRNIFLIKYDNTGSIAWAKLFDTCYEQGSCDLQDDLKAIVETAGVFLILGTTNFADKNYKDLLLISIDQNGNVQSYNVYCVGSNGSCKDTVEEKANYIVSTNNGYLLLFNIEDPIVYMLDSNLTPDRNSFSPRIYYLGKYVKEALKEGTDAVLYGYTNDYGMGLSDGIFSIIDQNGNFKDPTCASASSDFDSELIKLSTNYNATNFLIVESTDSQFNAVEVTNDIGVSDDSVNSILIIDACQPNIVTSTERLVIDPSYVGLESVGYLVIQNRGLSDLVISGINIDGKDGKLFSYYSECVEPIKYKEMCTISVKVKPDSKDTKTARINIQSNDPNFSVKSIDVEAIVRDLPPAKSENKTEEGSKKVPVFTNVQSCSVFYGVIYIIIIPVIALLRRIFE